MDIVMNVERGIKMRLSHYFLKKIMNYNKESELELSELWREPTFLKSLNANYRVFDRHLTCDLWSILKGKWIWKENIIMEK